MHEIREVRGQRAKQTKEITTQGNAHVLHWSCAYACSSRESGIRITAKCGCFGSSKPLIKCRDSTTFREIPCKLERRKAYMIIEVNVHKVRPAHVPVVDARACIAVPFKPAHALTPTDPRCEAIDTPDALFAATHGRIKLIEHATSLGPVLRRGKIMRVVGLLPVFTPLDHGFDLCKSQSDRKLACSEWPVRKLGQIMPVKAVLPSCTCRIPNHPSASPCRVNSLAIPWNKLCSPAFITTTGV